MADPETTTSAGNPTPAPAPAPVPPLASVPALPPEVGEVLEWHWPNQSESITKLIVALAKAQGQIGSASKDSTNPHFKSRYASLAAVREACREALSAEGIAVLQFPTSAGGRLVTISTMLAFEDEFIVSHLTLRSAQDSPQGIAAATTYGRRVGLAAMVGVAPEDDDGNEASDTLPKGVKRQVTPPNPTEANKPDLAPQGQGAKLPEPSGAFTTSVSPTHPGGSAVVAAPQVARAPQAAPAPAGVPPPPGRPPMKAPGSN